MRLFQKNLLVLLAAVLALGMLTACFPAETPPSAPSKPGSSQGGTDAPGGDAGDNDPDKDPEADAPTWKTSKTRAYLSSKGVTETNYAISGKWGDLSATGTLHTYTTEDHFAISGTKQVYSMWEVFPNKNNQLLICDGYYTTGKKYYQTDYDLENDKTAWHRVTRTVKDPFTAYPTVQGVQKTLDYCHEKYALPTDTSVIRFASKTTAEGTAETVSFATGRAQIYQYDTAGTLKQIVFIEDENKEANAYDVLLNPQIKPATQCDFFPTGMNETPAENLEEEEPEDDRPLTWQASKTKKIFTERKIQPSKYYVLAEGLWGGKQYQIEVNGNNKEVLIWDKENKAITHYWCENGVYYQAIYENETYKEDRKLTSQDEIEQAIDRIEKIQNIFRVPASSEVVAFRAGDVTDMGGYVSYDEDLYLADETNLRYGHKNGELNMLTSVNLSDEEQEESGLYAIYGWYDSYNSYEAAQTKNPLVTAFASVVRLFSSSGSHLTPYRH